MPLRKLRFLNFPYHVSTMLSTMLAHRDHCPLGPPSGWSHVSPHMCLIFASFPHFTPPPSLSSSPFFNYSEVPLRLKTHKQTNKQNPPLIPKSYLALSCLIQVSPNSCFYFPLPNFSSTHFSPHHPGIRFFGSVMGWIMSPPNSDIEVLTLGASECDGAQRGSKAPSDREKNQRDAKY